MSEITFRPLEARDVEVRVAHVTDKGCSLLLYKDARCDMRLLDDAVGAENWECEYEQIGSTLYCRVGIYSSTRDEVVWKQDCGTESNMEAKKGEASDAFKRACFKWGIGRELYTAPFIWLEAGNCTISKNKSGKLACYDRFIVKYMAVDDGVITALQITNGKTGKVVYELGKHIGAEKPAKAPQQAATAAKAANTQPNRFGTIKQLKEAAMGLGVKEEGIKSWLESTFKGKPMKDFTPMEIKATEAYLTSLVADAKALKEGAAE